MASKDIERLAIEKKYAGVSYCLNERGKRLWAAAEAESYGRGGIALVCRATGLSNATIHKGLKELRDPIPPTHDRLRKAGGGRKNRRAFAVGCDPSLRSDLFANRGTAAGIGSYPRRPGILSTSAPSRCQAFRGPQRFAHLGACWPLAAAPTVRFTLPRSWSKMLLLGYSYIKFRRQSAECLPQVRIFRYPLKFGLPLASICRSRQVRGRERNRRRRPRGRYHQGKLTFRWFRQSHRRLPDCHEP